MSRQFPYKLYLVISEEACAGRDIVWVAEQAVKGGVDLVQIREKTKTTSEFIEVTLRLKQMLDNYSVPLIVNDNLGVAMHCNAYGIHVGNSDVPPSQIRQQWPNCKMLGYSVEYIAQFFNSEIQYADCLGISPVFITSTKTDTVTEWGLDGLLKIRGLTNKPLVAIGNMNADNAVEVIRAGADCLAVVSAICSADDPKRAAELIRNQIEKAL